MSKTFLLEIVTPERVLISEEVEEVICPGTDGEFGVLPDHSYLMTSLSPGVIIYKKDGEKTIVASGGGFAEVGPNKTTLLVDRGVFATEINLEDAKTRVSESAKAMEGKTMEDEGYLKAFSDNTTAKVDVKAAEMEAAK